MIRDSKYTSSEHLPSSIDKEPIKALAKTWDDALAEFMNTNTLLLWSSIDTESESVIDTLNDQLHSLILYQWMTTIAMYSYS